MKTNHGLAQEKMVDNLQYKVNIDDHLQKMDTALQNELNFEKKKQVVINNNLKANTKSDTFLNYVLFL